MRLILSQNQKRETSVLQYGYDHMQTLFEVSSALGAAGLSSGLMGY